MSPLIIRQASSDSKENNDNVVFSASAVLLVLSSTGLAARMVSKKMKRRQFLIDDILIIWAYIFCAGQTGMHIWAVKYAGFGRHLATLSRDEIVSFGKVFYSGSLIQPCVLALSKISVLLLLYRIFITKAFRMTALVLMAIVVSWWIAIFFAGAFICSPVKSHWDPDVPGHCGNQYLLNIVDPIPWILTDFAILFAPLPMVWKLHMPTRQKVALGGLFLVGGLTCIVSCVRYQYAFYSLTDPTWDSVKLANWNSIEAHVTVLCACLIASKPVFMFLIPDKPFGRIGSYFSRSFKNGGSRNKPSRERGPSEGNCGSRTYLPMNNTSSEFQRTPDCLHSEGTKTLQEAKDGVLNDDLRSASRAADGTL